MPHTCRSREERLAISWILGALAAAAVYSLSLAPGLLWEDSGDSQVRVLAHAYRDGLELSRAHIFYYAAAILLHQAGSVDAAVAANVVAMLAGAFAIGNLAALLTLLLEGVTARVAGTALFLFSHTMWQTSSVAEDNTCIVMLLSLELLAGALFLKTGRGRWLAVAALANGLGWSNHNWAMLIWPAYAVMAWRHWHEIPRVGARTAAVAALCWIAGWSPVAVLVMQEYLGGSGAVPALQSLLFGVSQHQIVTYFVHLKLAANSAGYLVLNFPTPLLPLAWLGWRTPGAAWPPGLRTLLSTAGLVYTLFTIQLDFVNQYRYFLPAYLILAIFLASGLDRWHAARPSRMVSAVVLAGSLLAPLVYWVASPLARRYAGALIPMPAHQLPYADKFDWYIRPWRTGYHGAEQYAHDVLASLPQGAVLITDYGFRRPIDYLQGRDGLRADVKVPFSTLPRPWQTEMQITQADFPEWADRGLLFCTCNDMARNAAEWIGPNYRVERRGAVYQVLRASGS